VSAIQERILRMKSAFVSMAAVAMFVLVGCNSGTTGGPGADKAKAQEKESKTKKLQDKISQPEDTFSLDVPTLSTKLKQGESKVVTIGIKRGKNFDQNVKLKLDGVPTGVTADPGPRQSSTATKIRPSPSRPRTTPPWGTLPSR